MITTCFKVKKTRKTVRFWKFFLKIHNLRFFIINVKYFLIFSEEKSYIFQKGIIYQDWSRSSYLNPMSKSLQLFWVTLYVICMYFHLKTCLCCPFFQIGKNAFLWNGFTNMTQTLAFLRYIGLCQNFHHSITMTREKVSTKICAYLYLCSIYHMMFF